MLTASYILTYPPQPPPLLPLHPTPLDAQKPSAYIPCPPRKTEGQRASRSLLLSFVASPFVSHSTFPSSFFATFSLVKPEQIPQPNPTPEGRCTELPPANRTSTTLQILGNYRRHHHASSICRLATSVIQHHHPPTPTTEIDILQPNLSRRWFSHRRAYIGIGDGDRDGCCRESIPSSCASAEAREPRPSQRERSDAASSAWRSRPPPHLPLFAQQWPR